MLSILLLHTALATSFVHPAPSPPSDLPAEVFQARRAKVMAALGGCTAVISSQGEVQGVTEDYRQDADFYWMTGINEPDAYLLFQPNSPYRKVTLFLKSRDPEKERWTGPRDPISPSLLKKYGVDRVYRGSPEDVLVNAGAHHDCVAIISPPTMTKEDRNDVELAKRTAERFGLKVI